MLQPNSGFSTHSSMVVFAIWFGLLVALAAGQGADPPCSSDNPRCLQVLRNYLTRTDWWFGDSYSTECPDGVSDKNFSCMNVDRQHKSILSRIFQGDSYDVNNITQLLRVRFYVPGGSYRACGRIFNVPSVSMDQDLDFSQRTGLDSWSLQKRPAITWDPTPGLLYTLVAYNVDLLQLAGLWVNIKGGDSALGYEIYPYSGPMYALNRTSFHAFLLLKQSAMVEDLQFTSLLAQIQSAMENNGLYRLSNLSRPVGQIQDLVGVGLISVGSDPYGIEVHKSSNIYNNCPWLFARMRPATATVVAVQGLAALGADVSNLEMEVEVSYRSEAITYTSCCRSMSVSQRTLNIDPINMNPVNPVYLRSPPFIRLSAVDMMNRNFFFGKMFTLVFLDMTAATMSSPSRRTSLQWLVVDSSGQYPSTGVSLKDYVMPLPPLDRNGSSLYMFFVFTQNDSLRNASWSSYCSNTNAGGECDFLVDKFAKDNHLHLSGISFFYSQPDMYSRMKLYENNTSIMDTACRGVSGYGRPCPDPCATTPKPVIATTAASGNKNNGVPPTIAVLDRSLLLLILASSLIVTVWRIL